MSLVDIYNFDDLVNEAERLVLDELESQLAKLPGGAEGVGEEKVQDMAAYALNNVKPLYRVNLLGRVYAQNVGGDYAEEIQGVVAEAIKRINQNPNP